MLLLTLLGLLFVQPGSGERGDMDISEWLKAKEELIKSLEDKLKHVERWQKDVEALEARLNATVDALARQKAEVDRLNEENEVTRFMMMSSCHIYSKTFESPFLHSYRPENETGRHREGD